MDHPTELRQECHVEPMEKLILADDGLDARIVGLSVTGMGCVNCGIRVRNGLLALDGVTSADVDWERGLAFVDYVPTKTSIDSICQAVVASGNDGRHNYRAQVLR